MPCHHRTINNTMEDWGKVVTSALNMDALQKSFLTNKFSFNFFLIENFAPIDYKSAKPAPQPREMPPYNGFGSEEDSLCNCLSLIPKPPKRDFIKFMDKDRYISHFSLLFEMLCVICYHFYNFEQVRKHP